MSPILCLVLRGAIQILCRVPLAPSTPATISLPQRSIIWTAANMPLVIQTKPSHHFHRDIFQDPSDETTSYYFVSSQECVSSSICLAMAVTLIGLGEFHECLPAAVPKCPQPLGS